MTTSRKTRWNENDRFAFSTARLRASTIPARRHDGPSADEWDWDDDGVIDSSI